MELFSFSSQVHITPDTFIAHLHIAVLLVKFRTLCPGCFFSDCLQCKNYYCTVYPVARTTSKNVTALVNGLKGGDNPLLNVLSPKMFSKNVYNCCYMSTSFMYIVCPQHVLCVFSFCLDWSRCIRKISSEFMTAHLVGLVFSICITQQHTFVQWDMLSGCR